MAKGQTYHDPQFAYIDAYSGREVIQLTDFLGHSNHPYFTDPCWINARSFFFMSDRENQSNLFRYDLDSGLITQLTDFTTRGRSYGCWSVPNQRVYYWRDAKIMELDPETFEEREIYRAPEGMEPESRANPTADGRYVISRLQEAVPQDRPSVAYAYSRFHELFHRKPLTQIIRVEVATGRMDILHEDKCYITHINTSPALPDIMTFCHEGPWHLVEQRIWGLNIQTGETWKIRPQDDGLDFAVGHEYWFADGRRIGYHGFPRDQKGEHVFGHLNWDNSGHTEVRFPYRSTHFCSLDETLIAGDGSPAAVFSHQGVAQPFIQLFKWDGEAYTGPRILAYHRSTFNDQHAHPHPRFSPDGRYVLYSSDLTGYANMYLVEVGAFDELPVLNDSVRPQHT
ncbi:MAG: oligogalacturonate lyase family protein [Anaerolineae bacterium]|nr:oligogalacturonate lyase family protein [Anaerolineae bacterium]NUQ04059.1 PD40 domain-containing protein [Anaerolineae bacterium]